MARSILLLSLLALGVSANPQGTVNSITSEVVGTNGIGVGITTLPSSGVVTTSNGVVVSVGTNGVSVGHATTAPTSGGSQSATSNAASPAIQPWTISLPLFSSIATTLAGAVAGAFIVL